MKFPLADWIDSHPGFRHDLARSGMIGAIRRPAPSPTELRSTDPEELRSELAELVRVAPERLFLTHGATESDAWVILYVARTLGRRAGSCRIAYPEYPPLFDGARAAGFDLRDDEGPADLAIVSQPRNPEGDEWPEERLLRWSEGARHLLIDETFREFGERRSLAGLPRDRVWATGSFTKFYAGDDLRVGFVVAPELEAKAFARFVGLFADGLSPSSVAGALSALRHRARIGAEVHRILAANRRTLARAFPSAAAPVAPVWFDRTGVRAAEITPQLLAASVLVCPGAFFGDPGGIRLCLTRRTFSEDLAAYVAVRGPDGGPRLSAGRASGRPARSRPAATGRGRAARG